MPKPDCIAEPPKATAKMAILAEYLHRYCRGRDAARSEAVVRGHLKAAGCRLSEREMRKLAGDAARLRTFPIGTTDAGFFWCVEVEDFAAARAYLVARFEPMRDRVEGIEAMCQKAFPPHTMLFDPWGGAAVKDNAR